MRVWHKLYGSRADFDAQETADERGTPNAAQLAAARSAAQAVLQSGSISGEIVVRLSGHSDSDNATDCINVTVSQR